MGKVDVYVRKIILEKVKAEHRIEDALTARQARRETLKQRIRTEVQAEVLSSPVVQPCSQCFLNCDIVTQKVNGSTPRQIEECVGSRPTNVPTAENITRKTTNELLHTMPS